MFNFILKFPLAMFAYTEILHVYDNQDTQTVSRFNHSLKLCSYALHIVHDLKALISVE
jgi:hypothetical protein